MRDQAEKSFAATDQSGQESEKLTAQRYNVITRTLAGSSAGVMTGTCFKNREAFEEWRTARMLDGTNRPVLEVYAVVAHGIPDDEMKKILESKENTDAAIAAQFREIQGLLDRAVNVLKKDFFPA